MSLSCMSHTVSHNFFAEAEDPLLIMLEEIPSCSGWSETAIL
jgi:hypothetical protein